MEQLLIKPPSASECLQHLDLPVLDQLGERIPLLDDG